jgi:transposase-like protein
VFAGIHASTIFDQGGLFDSLKKALAKRALNAEMDYHLGSNKQCGIDVSSDLISTVADAVPEDAATWH